MFLTLIYISYYFNLIIHTNFKKFELIFNYSTLIFCDFIKYSAISRTSTQHKIILQNYKHLTQFRILFKNIEYYYGLL